MSGLASGNGFSVTRTQAFTEVQTNALSADNANVASNERVANNSTDKGSILMGGSDALFNSRAVIATANGEAQNQTINLSTYTTEQEYSLGTQYKTGKNTYRYASFPAATAIATPGVLVRSQDSVTGAPSKRVGAQVHVAVSANAAAGATSVSFTSSTVIIDANSFAGGMMSVETTGTTTSPEATGYRIIANTAAPINGVVTLTLDPNTPLVAALAAADDITVVANDYALLIIVEAVTTLGTLVGVTLNAIASVAAIQYGWIQTSGDATVASEAAVFVGGAMVVCPGGVTPGCITVAPSPILVTQIPIGVAKVTVTPGVPTEGVPILLNGLITP